ncbi:MAG: hypothetical protein HQQ73_07530 [Desulfobulbaceae bacterium]|nr:hypothetical protein [Desulfobulbaceae bacterium]
MEHETLGAITELPLEALLPQRGRMLLLDAVLAGDTTFAITRSVVRAEWPLARANGVDALILVEIAAQTAGISCSWERLLSKGVHSEQKGWIVAIKRLKLHLAQLPFHAHIKAEGRSTLKYGGFQEVATRIHMNNALIAEVVLQLYQPQEG